MDNDFIGLFKYLNALFFINTAMITFALILFNVKCEKQILAILKMVSTRVIHVYLTVY